jgi:hypothetical protein
MAGHPRVVSSSEQLLALRELARSERRDEADRARAIVLSVNGWTSGEITQGRARCDKLRVKCKICGTTMIAARQNPRLIRQRLTSLGHLI